MDRFDRSLQQARELLGVSADAEPDQVIRAYRRAAITLHPDVSDASDAALRFEALADAYRLVLDAAHRRQAGPPTTASQRPSAAPQRSSPRRPVDPAMSGVRAGATFRAPTVVLGWTAYIRGMPTGASLLVGPVVVRRTSSGDPGRRWG